MILNGVGGGNTTSGAKFENQTDLFENLLLIDRFKNSDKENKVLTDNGKPVGCVLQKYDLYKFLKSKNVRYQDFISKKLLPDDSFYNYSNNTYYVIEKKFQRTSGSVDEKLQTCDFKLKQYKKLFSSLNINVKYCYLLSDWFKKPEYKDVLEYINSVGCNYFYNEIPLNYFNL